MAKKKGINKLYLVGGFTFPILLLVSVFVFGVGLPTAQEVQENPLTVPLANANVDDILNQLPEEIIIDIPPVTSEDPVRKQIDEIIYGANESILFQALVVKTDSLGKQTEKLITSSISPLTLFSTDGELQDFSDGSLSIRIKASATKLFTENFIPLIEGTANFDMLINNQTIFREQVILEINGRGCGITCAVPLVVCSLTNLPESCSFGIDNFSVFGKFIVEDGTFPEFTFRFTEISKAIEQEHKIEFVLTNVDLTIQGKKFGAERLVVYTMDLVNDNQNLLVTNEQGEPVKALKTDNDLTIIAPNPLSSIILTYTDIILREGNILGEGGIIAQGDPSLFATTVSNGTHTSIEGFPLQRDTTYNVSIKGKFSGSGFTTTVKWTLDVGTIINTPKSQQDYTFSCGFFGTTGSQPSCNIPNCGNDGLIPDSDGTNVSWGC